MPLDEEYVEPEPIPQYHYTTPLIGTGTSGDPFRPDVPAGTSYVVIGQPVNGEVLIVTPKDLPVRAGRRKQSLRSALEAQANARGIPYERALTGWWVSDGAEPVRESGREMH